jgi:tyrosine-specific transport protein
MPYIWAALPILATSFGFHVLIPSIRAYVGDQPKTLRFIIITGSSLPLLIYLLWEMVSLGVLPQTGPDSFASVAANHGSIGDFVIALQHYLQETRIGIGVNLFTDVAVTTSFLGVTLSLLDFIADAFRFKKTSVSGRSYASLLTFVPPIIFALFYPKGFIMALGYASICVAVILIIMPALMAWKLRKQHETLRRSLCGNRFILLLTVLLGIAIIALQIASNFGYLAK